MTADPRAMRGQADALRRAADRLTILRLRLANTVVDLSGAEDAATRALGERVHERWTLEEYPELGRIATGLRSSARRLDAAAVAAERSTGRRRGGADRAARDGAAGGVPCGVGARRACARPPGAGAPRGRPPTGAPLGGGTRPIVTWPTWPRSSAPPREPASAASRCCPATRRASSPTPLTRSASP